MLKKIIFTIFTLAAMSGLSYGLTNPDWISNVPGITFKTSNNVKVAYKNDGNTAVQAYAIVSKHDSGDTYYATSNISTAIYKLQLSAKLGVAMTLADTQVTGLAAGDSLFTGGGAYVPM